MLPWSPRATVRAEAPAVLDVLSEVCFCSSRETVHRTATWAYIWCSTAALNPLVNVFEEVALPESFLAATTNPINVMCIRCGKVPQEVFPLFASPIWRTGSAMIRTRPRSRRMLGFHVCPIKFGQVSVLPRVMRGRRDLQQRARIVELRKAMATLLGLQ
jgi:hypothetical protein